MSCVQDKCFVVGRGRWQKVLLWPHFCTPLLKRQLSNRDNTKNFTQKNQNQPVRKKFGTIVAFNYAKKRIKQRLIGCSEYRLVVVSSS